MDQTHSWSNINTEERTKPHHEKLYTSIINFTYNILTTYNADYYGLIQFERDVLLSYEYIIFILVDHNKKDYILYYLIWSKICHLHMFIIDYITWLIEWIIIYSWIICKYWNTNKDRLVLGYPTRDSKYNIPSRKSQMIIFE